TLHIHTFGSEETSEKPVEVDLLFTGQDMALCVEECCEVVSGHIPAVVTTAPGVGIHPGGTADVLEDELAGGRVEQHALDAVAVVGAEAQAHGHGPGLSLSGGAPRGQEALLGEV